MTAIDRTWWAGRVVCALVLSTTACSSRSVEDRAGSEASDPSSGPAAVASRTPVVVEERFVSDWDDADDLDTPSVWFPEGGAPTVVTTAKQADVLVLHDAVSGLETGRVGAPGVGPREFERPNAVLILEDFAIVVERDNRRIQVLRLPGFESIGWFGDDVLEKPYGVTTAPSVDDGTALRLFVTDDFDVVNEATGESTRPPVDRIKEFAVSFVGDTLRAEHIASYGDAEGGGALMTVETIWADAAYGRLLVADESDREFAIFDVTGSFTGSEVGGGDIEGDPEGLGLWECGQQGYWVITDQRPDTSVFHIYDRASLRHLGAFRGAVTTNTDGIAVTSKQVGPWTGGAVYAVHNDGALSGFAWSDVAEALGLTPHCSGP